jgi:hypothetical protein
MPTRDERVELIRTLEGARGGTHVIAYLTSTRDNLESQMAMDAVPIIYEHLRTITTPKEETKIDLFLHSNGGDGVVPWRLVPLIRERCSRFTVLVPHHAFSAATLTALGADTVIMHPLGCLGPTDPTVTNQFNPQNPQNPKQLLGISVEDVSSYIDLVKSDVGIQHEEELVQAFAILARKVHPLALGNVKRATSQSRMMGEKLLKLRKDEAMDAHDVTELIENLTSQLYFHGHPINRIEARDDLRLGFVEDATPEVEAAMWDLYRAYVTEMRLNEPWLPAQEAYAVNPLAAPNPPTMIMTAAGPQHVFTAPATATVNLASVKAVMVESTQRTDVHQVEFEVTLKREWNGELGANVFPRTAVWVTDATAPAEPGEPEEPGQEA